MFHRLGSESIFGSRKSDPTEAEGQCLRLCRQPQEKRGSSWLELGYPGFWGTELDSWPERDWGWGWEEEKVRENKQEVLPSLLLYHAGSVIFANSKLLGEKIDPKMVIQFSQESRPAF